MIKKIVLFKYANLVVGENANENLTLMYLNSYTHVFIGANWNYINPNCFYPQKGTTV